MLAALRVAFGMLVLVVATGAEAPPRARATAMHPNSISRSVIRVTGERAEVELAVQALTVIEELGGDVDLDLELSPSELDAIRADLARYVEETFLIHAAGVAVPGVVTKIRAEHDPDSGGTFPMMGQWLFLSLEYTHDVPLSNLVIEFRLFEVTNSAHLDFATLFFNDEDPQSEQFALGERRWEHETWAARRPRVIRAFALRGARDVSRSAAAIALFVALVCIAPRRRGAWGAIGVAALGVGLGAAPGALDLLPTPSAFAGLAAALSAAYVATDALLRRVPRTPLLESAIFGLLNGVALGEGARIAVGDEYLSHAAAIGLDLGTALAAIPIALGVCAVLWAIPGDRAVTPEEDEDVGVDPQHRWGVAAAPRKALCVAVALVGFALFAARAGFV